MKLIDASVRKYWFFIPIDSKMIRLDKSGLLKVLTNIPLYNFLDDPDLSPFELLFPIFSRLNLILSLFLN